MAAGSKPGEHRGGRAPGTKNRATLAIEERLASMGCDPLVGMARIASGDVPCGTCHGELKTRYRLPEGHHAESCAVNKRAMAVVPKCDCEGIGLRTCESCYGTNKEKVTPDLRGRMYAELAQYVAPKRKAIEVKNAVDANGDQSEFKIKFVNAVTQGTP